MSFLRHPRGGLAGPGSAWVAIRPSASDVHFWTRSTADAPTLNFFGSISWRQRAADHGLTAPSLILRWGNGQLVRLLPTVPMFAGWSPSAIG